MADDIEFVSGLIVKAPRENAPDFVKGSISINVQSLSAWLATKTEEWVNIDVKESKGGKWYASVSTFKPKTQEAAPKAAPKRSAQGAAPFNDGDIPF